MLLQASGEILAVEAGTQNVVFSLPQPIMVDQEGNAVAVAVDLLKTGADYLWIYRLDEKWLESAAYPVTVDPTILSSLEIGDIHDTRVASGLPTTNYTNSYIMCTGWGSSSGINYSLVKFLNLPPIGSSAMVVHAGYRVKRATASASASTVAVHEITGSWNTATVTWNTKPAFNSIVEDYQVVPGNATEAKWDITRIAKSWYNGGANNGVLLKDISDSGNYKEWYTTNATYGDVPYAYFVYTNYAGLENYWDYTSSSIGRGGTANVNLYNGNMVYIHSDLEMDGNRMPVSVSHVFNSTYRDAQNRYGKGWVTNYEQRVHSVSIGDINYYSYVDQDVTAHYFRDVNGEWKVEDGIDLKLTVGSDEITIQDKEENKMVFYPDTYTGMNGYLKYIEDSNGNRQTLNYSGGGVLNGITDGAGRTTTFIRDMYHTLTGIVDPSDRTTAFAYNANGQLETITYPDNKVTTFGYDANGNLTSATNFDGKKLTISYQSLAPFRVTQLEESNGALLGGRLSLSYGYNRTELTDVDNHKVQYQFDDYGTTKCVIGPDGSASYTKFERPIMDAEGKPVYQADLNKITSASKLQKFGNNLLFYHSAEGSTYWTFENIGTSTGTGTFATDEKYLGKRSFKITKTNADVFSVCYQHVVLEPNKTYNLSFYSKTNTPGGGAYAQVNFFGSGGPYSAYMSEPISGVKDWQRSILTFTTPANFSSCIVYLYLAWTTGTAWFDCVQLEEGFVANRYNLIENADFTKYAGSTPEFWTRNNLAATDTVDTSVDSYNPPYLSDTRAKIVGDGVPGNWKSYDQTIQISGIIGDAYVLGGWAKGTSVPQNATRVFCLSAEFKNSSGSSYKTVAFNEDSQIWQYACGAVVADIDYTSMVIRLQYSGNANTAWFDGIQLFREQFGESFSYDTDGNLENAFDLQGKKDKFEYTNNDLTKYVTPDQRNYTYSYYENNHNLKTAVTPTGLAYFYSYDAFGNQKESKLGNASQYIRSTASYTPNGNYIDIITDPFGKQMNYDFDPTKGTLTSVTDPLGKTVNYSYDSNLDRLTGASMSDGGKTISNSYSYTNDYLTTVAHNGPVGDVSFGFEYNGLGWLTKTKVGTQSLATNTLRARTGRLDSTTYGNGQIMNFTYDTYDRLIKISQSAAELYAYEYDNAGNIGYQKDSVNNKEFWYEYDSMQRLGRVISKDATGTINYTSYGFDSKNSLTSFKERIAGTEYATSYTYDNEDRIATMEHGPAGVALSYDPILGRMTRIERKNGVNVVHATTFAYAPGDGSTSTDSARISALTNGSETLNYTYDDRGFITSVSSGSNSMQYRYDAFGQLIRENYSWGGTSYTMLFTYDVGGNMTEKKKYNYVAGEDAPTNLLNTATYIYDATWKDKLVSYAGNSITYDPTGNPLNDGRWTYTWTHGRRLSGMIDGTTTISYKYNNQGVRTEKTINGVTTKYNLAGNRVTWEKKGSGTPIYFIYNDSGSLWGLKYNGSVYFYVRNALNDIIRIVDTTGVTVIEYNYDVWGKMLNISGSMASTMGQDNPYRYKGYRYDSETGLYYLQDRYYNPEWGRFLNSDNTIGRTGELEAHNQYLYCKNNPVLYADFSGDHPILIGMAIGAGVSLISSIVVQASTGDKKISLQQTLTDVAVGTISGGIAGSGVGLVLMFFGNAALSGGASIAKNLMETGSISWEDALLNAGVGGVVSLIGGRGIMHPAVRKTGDMLLNVVPAYAAKQVIPVSRSTMGKLAAVEIVKGTVKSSTLSISATVGIEQARRDRDAVTNAIGAARAKRNATQ